MKLLDRVFANRDGRIRQSERERILALAKGDVRGCAGYDCEECDRMCLIDDIREVTKDWEELY